MEQAIKIFPYFKVTAVDEGLIFSTTLQIADNYYPVIKTFPDMRMLPNQLIECTPTFFLHVEKLKKRFLDGENE